ncbi:MAG: hypothetical protein HC854_02495 [Flavobacterium sp.]|nr:hypothetical protein [Flavobacterium sp.]
MEINDDGIAYGNASAFESNGNSNIYGNHIYNSNIGNGIHWGNYNLLTSSGNGNQAGIETVINNWGNGFHYGQINSLSGLGTGSKYGTFNYIDAASGGIHIGLYSQATQAIGYSGYFLGNVFVSGVFTNPSDSSLKENIKESASVLLKLNQLKVKDYNFKSDLSQKYGFARGQQTGFIAQELEQVFPNLVKEEILSIPNDPTKIAETTQEERKIKAINYVGLIPYLTKAIQEQQEVIIAQKNKVASLELEVQFLKEKQKLVEERLLQLEKDNLISNTEYLPLLQGAISSFPLHVLQTKLFLYSLKRASVGRFFCLTKNSLLSQKAFYCSLG